MKFLPIIIFVLTIIMVYADCVYAEPSNHTTQHKATQAEILKQCGIALPIVQPTSDSWVSNGDGSISGPGLRITCPSGQLEQTVSFTPPTEREDGTPLGANEIIRYEIKFSGINVVAAKACDQNLCSEWSNYNDQ